MVGVECNSLALQEDTNVIFCILCGENHNFDQCDLVKITQHVKDNEVLSRARLSLPNTLEIQKLADETYSVIAKVLFEKGTCFGPVNGEVVEGIDFETSIPLKLFFFDGENNEKERFLSLVDENVCNWMMFISSANYSEEQNLICYQDKDKIFYVAIKNIEVGDTLKVWYSPYYASKMNKPLLSSEFPKQTENNIDISSLIKKQHHILDREIWNCKFCSFVEKDIARFAGHILQHYSAQLSNICEICKAAFRTRAVLKKHYSIVHKPIVSESLSKLDLTLPTTCNFTTKDVVLGGPLLNDVFTDSLDLPQNEFSQFHPNLDNQTLLLDNEENLDFGSVKDLDHFNFEIDDNQKHFVCDLCLKQFAKLKLLVEHLKSHTGKFTCFKCLKIFCRNESLKVHVCTGIPQFDCSLCEKRFGSHKNLLRHISAKHKKEFECTTCNNLYFSKKDLLAHICKKKTLVRQALFTCSHCNKQFHQSKYLKRHSKLHELHSKTPETVCDICGVQLKEKSSYHIHQKKHFDSEYMCEICDKKFYRKDTLKLHIMTHQNVFNYECDKCDKKFKTLKIWQSHKTVHSSNTPVQCSLCKKHFKSRYSLKNHLNLVHNSEISTKLLKCPICEKLIKLRSSLVRHLKTVHPNNKINMATQSKALKQKTVNLKMQRQESVETVLNEPNAQMERDMSTIIPEVDKDIQISLDKKSPSEKLLHTDRKDNNEPREICLSIPDLTEEDQEITLGNNAYILENGTIVQPQESSDQVVIYVLNQPFT